MVSIPVIQGKDRPVIEIDKGLALDLLGQLPQEQLIEELSKQDPFLWIYKNVPTEFGRKLDFTRRPYLAKILRDFSPHIVYKKAAQVGITMCGGIAKCLYAADKIGLTAIYTFPTARDVSDFSKGRFRHIVHGSKYLANKIGDIDNAGMVMVGDSAIYFKGTWNTRQGLSIPSHLNIHDELNFSHPDVRETFSSRLDAAEFDYNGKTHYGWEWDFSTPTLPKYGVSRLYDMSDHHEWWVRCAGCRRRQRVNFFKNMRQDSKHNRYFGCLKCDKELDRTKGEWVPRKPGAKIRGYHITQPMCAFISAQRMYDTYENLKNTSEGKRKFFNFNLGLDYEDGTDTITRSLVLNRVIESSVTVGPVFVGADQGDILHVVVSKMVSGIRRIIWIGTLNSFEDFERLVLYYRARIAVIDALPNHHNARTLSKKHHNIYAAYYGGMNKLERSHWEKDLKNKEVKIPRTDLLDKTASEWNNSSVIIENSIPVKFIEDFAEQMSNSKRLIQETKNGEPKAEWVKINDDHYRHADSYNWLATEIGRSSFSSIMDSSIPYEDLAMGENIFQESEVW